MREIRFALKNTFPIFFTYVFLGIAFGILVIEAGYTIPMAVCSAVFVFAGSMQFIMVPMLVAGAPLWSLALMTVFVNGRHIFYGIGFIEKFRKAGWRFPYMVFALSDETYSILCAAEYDEGLNVANADFLVALFDQSYWILGCTLGACAGTYLNFDLSGIDFAATALFLVVVVNQWRQHPSKIPFFIGAVTSIGCLLVLGADYFLIPALTLCLLGLLATRKPIEAKDGADYE